MDISTWFDTFHDVSPDMVMGAYVTPEARHPVFGGEVTITASLGNFNESLKEDKSRNFVLVLMGGYQFISKTYPGPKEAEAAACDCLKKIREEE